MTGWGTWWCSAILVAFAILFGGASNRAHGDEGRTDDGWRRTAQGWERMESWTAPQSTALYGYRFDTNDRPAGHDRRTDVHPAVFLGLLLLVVGAALLLLPPARLTNGSLNAISDGSNRRHAA